MSTTTKVIGFYYNPMNGEIRESTKGRAPVGFQRVEVPLVPMFEGDALRDAIEGDDPRINVGEVIESKSNGPRANKSDLMLAMLAQMQDEIATLKGKAKK